MKICVAIYHKFDNNPLDTRFFVSKNYSETILLFGSKKLYILVNRLKGAMKCHCECYYVRQREFPHAWFK